MSQTPLFQYVKPKLFIAYLEQNGFYREYEIEAFLVNIV